MPKKGQKHCSPSNCKPPLPLFQLFNQLAGLIGGDPVGVVHVGLPFDPGADGLPPVAFARIGKREAASIAHRAGSYPQAAYLGPVGLLAKWRSHRRDLSGLPAQTPEFLQHLIQAICTQVLTRLHAGNALYQGAVAIVIKCQIPLGNVYAGNLAIA